MFNHALCGPNDLKSHSTTLEQSNRTSGWKYNVEGEEQQHLFWLIKRSVWWLSKDSSLVETMWRKNGATNILHYVRMCTLYIPVGANLCNFRISATFLDCQSEQTGEPQEGNQVDQTLPTGSGESFTGIILKTNLCLVLDFRGFYGFPWQSWAW